MTHNKHKKESKETRRLVSERDERRLSTLKLWQLHIQSLSKPENESLMKRYNEDYELTEMHTISESTIVSSDCYQTRVTLIEDDDHYMSVDMYTGFDK